MNSINNGITFNTIRCIYITIFGQQCDNEEVNKISIDIAQLIEFQGQGIMSNWRNVFIDRDNTSICREIVKDIKNWYPFSPFRCIILYRTKGR